MAAQAEDFSPPQRLRSVRRFLGRPARVWSRRARKSRRVGDNELPAAAISAPISPLFGKMTWLEPQDSQLREAVAARLEALQEGLTSLLHGGSRSEDEGAAGFPQRHCPAPADGQGGSTLASQEQGLVATGGKQWGTWWDGRGLLKVKIYDFALYANPAHVNAALPALPPAEGAPPVRAPLRRLRRRRAAAAAAVGDDALAGRVGANNAVEMTVCVRPARDLPLSVMRAEYHRILQKRMRGLGGSPDDPCLAALLRFFDEAALPASMTRRGCVRKGAVLHFSRTRRGELTAVADGVRLTTVRSGKLCEAVFDLYLGDAPVSKKARTAASESFRSLAAASQPLTATV